MRHTDDTLTRCPVGEEDGHEERELFDWWKVKPSTSPPLSWAEVLALPEGMVVCEGDDRDAGGTIPLMVLRVADGERQARIWRHDQRWSAAFPLQKKARPEPIYLPRLPRLSFALTTDAVRERRKTVTRRVSLPSWWKEGAYFLGVDKIRQAGAQGLCIGRCGMATKEPLVSIEQDDVIREGFDTTPEGFINMFRSSTPRDWDGWVWRMPFSYLEIPE